MTHKLKLDNMNAFELEQTAKLLCIDFIPGCNLINTVMFTGTRLPFIIYNFGLKRMKKPTVDFSENLIYKQ